MHDVKSSLEHLRKTLAETEKQINELRTLLESLTEMKEKDQPKVENKNKLESLNLVLNKKT